MLSPNAIYTVQSLLPTFRDCNRRVHKNIIGATEVVDYNNKTLFSRLNMVAAHRNSQQVMTVTAHIRAVETQDTPNPEIPVWVGRLLGSSTPT